MSNDAPTFGNGKICYIEIPAVDVQASSRFYHDVFGWNVRTRGDGSVAFDDGVGQVSGTWRLDRKPVADAQLVIHIMVDDALATIDKITDHGGKIVQGIGADHPEITARFSDPAGNVLSIYQHHK